MASSKQSTRNASTSSSAWLVFNPYGDETDSNVNTSVSSSDGWPLDEIMNDIEKQMDQQNEAILGMTSQMDDIEVSLTAARNRRARKKKSPSSSLRSSLSFNKSRSYQSMEDDEKDIGVDPSDNVDRSNDISPRMQSFREIMERRSEFKRELEEGSFSSSVQPDLVPPSQLQNPRRSLRTTQRPLSRVDPSPNAVPELPPASRSSLYLSTPKKFGSSTTWEESVSSQPSCSSEDEISELGATTVASGKPNIILGSRKLKYFLVVLAAILVLLVGVLTGQWVQQRQKANEGSFPSSSQQVQRPTDAPVVAPTLVGNIPANVPSITTEAEKDNAKEDIIGVGNAEETVSNQVNGSTEETQYPTLSPTVKPIEASPASNVVVNEQTPNDSDTSYDYTANSNFLVGVYYYPWHGERFHNGGGYMRKDLEPPHVPTLGEYNDSDPKVIGHHMKWFRQANIGLLVTSWWGPNRLEDSNTKDVIMEHEDVGNLKIALHYETTSRLGSGTEKLPNAKTDIQYMCENYFDHPNYHKIDGRPVLFIYISRKLHVVGTLEEALLTMRSTASKCGHNLYLIGDSVFESAPDPNESHVPFWYFDAVTNYDVYGSSGRPEGHVGTDGVDNYYRQQNEWKQQAARDECRYIPAVSPGYNDRGVRMEADHPPLSRRITADSQEGSLFHYQLKQARQLVDPKVGNMILVNSFNEWHEDTQIEPVNGSPSSMPQSFTKGLEYVGYGELYLDILGAATSKDESRHNVFDYLLSGR